MCGQFRPPRPAPSISLPLRPNNEKRYGISMRDSLVVLLPGTSGDAPDVAAMIVERQGSGRPWALANNTRVREIQARAFDCLYDPFRDRRKD